MKRIITTTSALILLFAAYLGEAKSIQRFSIASGMIEYEITGGGEVMGVVTKTKGSKSLYFRDYGAMMSEEEKITTTLSGSVQKETKTHSLTKTDNITTYKVDFKTRQIMKGTDPVASQYLISGKNMSEASQKMLEGFGGKKIGTDKVLGRSCEIWQIMGGKQCLYKGQIPLWIELDIMGVKNKTRAIKAEFDVKIPDKQFELPKYSITESPMYVSEEEALQQAQQMQEMGQMMQGVQEAMKANPEMSEAEQEALMMQAISQSDRGKNQLQQQKEQMPKLVMIMKAIRTCLSHADTLADAESCDKKAAKMAKEMGIEDFFEEDDEMSVWDEQIKIQTLSELDEGIKDMESILPCIQKAQVMSDLMQCHE